MKFWYHFIFIVLFCMLPKSGWSYLGTSGRDIVDSQGTPVLLTGFGLGGWLVPEGYMLHIPGFGSPTDIENKITDLVGADNADYFWQTYHANYVTKADIAQIAEWGFNSIRLPFHYKLFSPKDQPGVFITDGFEIVDRLLAWCKEYELYLILDMHCAPGGQNDDNISDSDGTARLWTDSANQQRTIDIWERIAKHYADEPWIGGYDLLNEPVLPTGHSNAELRQLYIDITAAIRKHDPHHIVFIEGNGRATNFSQLAPFDDNLVYSFHKYYNQLDLESIRSYLQLRELYNVPLWLGETGENSNPWAFRCIQLMRDNKIGWNWWTHKKVQTTSSPYSVLITPAYQRILDYWRGETARPTIAEAMRGLIELAEGLKLENCEMRPDILDALTRRAFSGRSTSFAYLTAPGMIPAAHYDMGDNGVAYYDSRSLKTDGLYSAAWNEGHQFRNDGVDIEPAVVAAGVPFNVGWTTDGEWLRYTIEVETEGLYNVTFRLASPNSGGRFALYQNGLPLGGTVTVQKTGGWQSWQTQSLGNIPLKTGEQTLEFRVFRGDFNIAWMNFELESEIRVDDFLPEQQKIISPLNIYPNPTNGNVIVEFTLQETRNVTIDVFNLSGKRVKTLFRGNLESGFHRLRWEAADETGQLVAAGLYWIRLVSDDMKRTRRFLFTQ